MKTYVNLLEGKILPALSALALPIMATSFIQMAYNLTDMIWIGRIGANAVASVGAAGMFMWLSNGLATLAKMGGQIKVGQSLGHKNIRMLPCMHKVRFKWESLSQLFFLFYRLSFLIK